MAGETGCCGFHFQEKGPNMLGLMTLSYPLMLAGALTVPGFMVLSRINPAFKRMEKIVLVIIKANAQLIRSAAIYPKVRCSISAKIYAWSPKLSGAFYRHYNALVLSLLWLFIFSLIILVNLYC